MIVDERAGGLGTSLCRGAGFRVLRVPRAISTSSAGTAREAKGGALGGMRGSRIRRQADDQVFRGFQTTVSSSRRTSVPKTSDGWSAPRLQATEISEACPRYHLLSAVADLFVGEGRSREQRLCSTCYFSRASLVMDRFHDPVAVADTAELLSQRQVLRPPRLASYNAISADLWSSSGVVTRPWGTVATPILAPMTMVRSANTMGSPSLLIVRAHAESTAAVSRG